MTMAHTLKTGATSYDVTAEDKLWLLRAVSAEGAPREQVARALVNLFMYRREKQHKKETLARLVRAYAQPVNPRWYPDGDLHLAAVSSALPQSRAPLELAAHRRATVISKRTEFTPETIDAVDAALSTGWNTDITDYAAPTINATHKGYVARSAPKAGENRFWSRAVGWAGYAAENASGSGALVAFMILAVLLLRRGA